MCKVTGRADPNILITKASAHVTRGGHFTAQTVSSHDGPKPEWIKMWYVWNVSVREYYSAIKKNIFESVLMRWMNLEPIIQSEVSQKEKNKHILMHIYEI